jgi:nucleoside-diphosphate-sugar epimerase
MGVMKLLVTGANGFLGRHVVAEALRRGHTVRAMVRSVKDAGRNGWVGRPNIEWVQADLRSRRGLVDAVAGCDAVLHLAAAKSGDIYTQYAGTVVATENLLAAMTEAGVRRIVAVSSLSVYDFLHMKSGAVLDEDSPLDVECVDRDEYAHTKVVQENLVRDHATKHAWDFTILRPGVIYGKDNLWTARLGHQGKRVWVRIGARAHVPLTYVENCAEAVVMSAEKDEAVGQTLNVIDDDPPTQRRYCSLIRQRTMPRPLVVPLPWPLMRAMAGVAGVTNRLLFRGRAKVPGLFIRARLHARSKPLKFANSKIKQVLAWHPRYSLSQALERTFASPDVPAAEPTATATAGSASAQPDHGKPRSTLAMSPQARHVV